MEQNRFNRRQILEDLLEKSARVLAQSHEIVRTGRVHLKETREHMAEYRRMKEQKRAASR